MMRQIMMTSAFVLAAAAFAMPAAAQNNTGSVKQEEAEMRKLQEVCAKNWPVVDKNDDTRISRQEAQEATKESSSGSTPTATVRFPPANGQPALRRNCPQMRSGQPIPGLMITSSSGLWISTAAATFPHWKRPI
jgi:hypothetical protein